MRLLDPRRLAPRVRLDGLCGMVVGADLRPASMTDLSWGGLRIEMVFDPKHASRTLQLEIEVPEVDEIMWAHGHVTFAHISPLGGRHADGQPRLWVRAGVQLDATASRHRRLIRDYCESFV
jgi:hypothetical protein